MYPQSSSSSASSSMSRRNYDAFLSFRGVDTGRTLISHLYPALCQKGVSTFTDSEELEAGQRRSELFDAIEGSRVAIVTFSENYARSKWCLDELQKIMECRGQGKLTVIPIFYHVSPREVRMHEMDNGEKGCYQMAMEEMEAISDSETVKGWRKALWEGVDLIGIPVFSGQDEGDVVQDVVGMVMKILTLVPLEVAKHPLGITYWEKGMLLGRGSFGPVYEGISDDGFLFAVKEVSLHYQGAKESILQLEQEIALLSQFKHQNIVRYYGTTKDEFNLYIFLELVTKGSLLNLYHTYHLRDSQVSAYTRQILNGLKYLHDHNVVHRDIKCANILVDASGSVKLADFGLAKVTSLIDVKSMEGTVYWMAPEVVGTTGYGLPADIWSLGCTVLEMLTQQLPYYPLEFVQALVRIGSLEQPTVPDTLSADAKDFILRCVQVNPDDRPTAAQLLEHPFVKGPLTPSGLLLPILGLSLGDDPPETQRQATEAPLVNCALLSLPQAPPLACRSKSD